MNDPLLWSTINIMIHYFDQLLECPIAHAPNLIMIHYWLEVLKTAASELIRLEIDLEARQFSDQLFSYILCFFIFVQNSPKVCIIQLNQRGDVNTEKYCLKSFKYEYWRLPAISWARMSSTAKVGEVFTFGNLFLFLSLPSLLLSSPSPALSPLLAPPTSSPGGTLEQIWASD